MSARERLEAAFARLPAHSRSAWRRHFGFSSGHGQMRAHVEARRRDEEIAALYLGGNTMGEIARAIGVSRERVRQRLARRGITKKDKGGWKNGTPVFSRWRRQWDRELRRAAKSNAFWHRAVLLLKRERMRLGRTPTINELGRALGYRNYDQPGLTATRLVRDSLGRSRPRGMDYKTVTRLLYRAAGMRVRPRGHQGHAT